jgi:molecular chaperone DnaK (HSP70)
MYTNITNTIYNIKRVIGKPYNDSILQKELIQYPYKIVNKDNIPVINYEDKQFTPEEITAMFLRESRNRASAYLGYNVTSAVITVPSYFNNAQRIATMNAGTIAGLDVKRIINEQSAAALTYGVNKMKQNPEDYLIFHVGGGTFNISLVTMGKGIIRVNATSGDTLLGGEDFDNILVDWCIDKIIEDDNIDIRSNPLSMRKLKDSCEKAKIELSSQMETIIECKSLYEDTDFRVTLTRDKFNSLCIHLFELIISSMNSILPPATKNIKDVVLVGGSTNIPKIQNMLFSILPHLLKNTQINSDNMVVNGAAIQGYYLMKQSRSIQLVDTLNDTTIGI